MITVDEHGRPEPPLGAGELEMLLGFLDWQRSTLAWKTRGLGHDELARTIPSSSITLGGILKHLAWVEDHRFSHVLHHRPRARPWAAIDLAADANWEWTSARSDTPEELRSLWSASVVASRDAMVTALGRCGLDQPAARIATGGEAPSLRWILVHMIEEYARHNGHADLLREAIDGLVGE